MPIAQYENGKYTIFVDDDTGKVKLYRHGEVWDDDPLYSKMFITIAYDFFQRNVIHAWGFTGHRECIVGCSSLEESWAKVSLDMKKALGDEFDSRNCKVIEIENGKFFAYDIGE